MLIEDDADDDVLVAAERPRDAEAVALTHGPVRLGVLAVDLHLSAFARALGLGARPEQAGDVEPDVETDGVAQIRISIFAFAFSASTNACVSACRLC
jgi:hypothetical protein